MSNERAFKSAEEYRLSRISYYGNSSYNGLGNGFQQPIYIHRSTNVLWNPGRYQEDKEVDWMSYRLMGLPGCCGIAVSYNSQIMDELQGNGLGEHFHKERLSLIKDSGYSLAMATSIESNVVQKELFEKMGWKDLYSF